MSTFDGIIREFPGVRGVVNDPPLACFLSHIHSDHLAGLDTYRGCFVYCSAATRAMLLKLQRKASRLNFAQGILEVEEVTYKHQKNRLKSLPMNTPTNIELGPNDTVRVTLLDANHCPGAVMFLFEGNGKAVLYTGDIRSEPWHVEALLRNPCMVEYSMGRNQRQLKTLDKIYLDTSFTEDVQFQTKADGLRELLEKVAEHPKDTFFYFSAWTYGYEDVWIALAKALNTRIHVDDYKMKVYESLRVRLEDEYHHLSPESPALVGFSCGNRAHPGCLTRDPDVRLHSCEKGSGCPMMQKTSPGNVVWITPIVAHLRDKNDMVEVGIGGGAGDLEDTDHVVLAVEDLRQWRESARKDQNMAKDTKTLLQDFLTSAISGQHPIVLTLVEEDESDKDDENDLRTVYRSLLAAAEENRGVTIEGLFGEHCSGEAFDHDKHMAQMAKELDIKEMDQRETQTSAESRIHSSPVLGVSSPIADASSPIRNVKPGEVSQHHEKAVANQATTAPVANEDHDIGDEPHDGKEANRQHEVIDFTLEESEESQSAATQHIRGSSLKRSFGSFVESAGPVDSAGSLDETTDEDNSHLVDSQVTSVSARAVEARRAAFNSVLHESNPARWAGLLSTTNNHTQEESELGEE
ncbi:hypothetical protein diail_3746 [Diaporthe ilicicola]|nr:hypothetical protein diail_3746 [Diaporthe ilicicola]